MFGLYEIAGGRLLSVGTVLADPLPDGTATRALPEGGVAFSSHDWDAAAADWVPHVATADTRLTVLQFKGRFTQAERDLIEIATVEHPDRTVRARLRMLDKDLESVAEKIVDRRDARTQIGIGMLAQITFEGVALLEPGRVAEIIGADAL
jgi:hypothetical protein